MGTLNLGLSTFYQCTLYKFCFPIDEDIGNNLHSLLEKHFNGIILWRQFHSRAVVRYKKKTMDKIFNRVFYRRVISKYKHTRTERRIHHLNDRVNSGHLLTTTATDAKAERSEVGANYRLCKWFFNL